MTVESEWRPIELSPFFLPNLRGIAPPNLESVAAVEIPLLGRFTG
jgi:hypothetical protein